MNALEAASTSAQARHRARIKAMSEDAANRRQSQQLVAKMIADEDAFAEREYKRILKRVKVFAEGGYDRCLCGLPGNSPYMQIAEKLRADGFKVTYSGANYLNVAWPSTFDEDALLGQIDPLGAEF